MREVETDRGHGGPGAPGGPMGLRRGGAGLESGLGRAIPGPSWGRRQVLKEGRPGEHKPGRRSARRRRARRRPVRGKPGRAGTSGARHGMGARGHGDGQPALSWSLGSHRLGRRTNLFYIPFAALKGRPTDIPYVISSFLTPSLDFPAGSILGCSVDGDLPYHGSHHYLSTGAARRGRGRRADRVKGSPRRQARPLTRPWARKPVSGGAGHRRWA